MLNTILIVILAILIIFWLYGFIFYDDTNIPNHICGYPISARSQFLCAVFCYPFVQFYKCFRTLCGWMSYILLDVIFEILIMGIWQILWLMIRGVFMLSFRVFD